MEAWAKGDAWRGSRVCQLIFRGRSSSRVALALAGGRARPTERKRRAFAWRCFSDLLSKRDLLETPIVGRFGRDARRRFRRETGSTTYVV